MKLRILSDLHLDVAPFTYKKGMEDVVVLAGDIATQASWGRFTNLISSIDKPIVYIKGNHESYGSVMSDVDKALRDLESVYSHFHFLDNQTITIDGYNFIGSVLWSNLDLAPIHLETKIKEVVAWGINDFRMIRNVNSNGEIKLFSVDTMIAKNLAARSFIKNAVVKGGKNIVVTHFCPSEKSIHEQYKGSALNSYFTCNCENLMTEDIPIWIHGHTHSAFDYVIGTTRVICNPRGYKDENAKAFISTLTVNV